VARSEGNPTEEPTPQRLSKARQRGQVAVSRDLSAALGFGAAVVVFSAEAPAGFSRILSLFQHELKSVAAGRPDGFAMAGATALQAAAPLVVIPLGAMLAMGVLMGAMQTGGIFSWQAARPDLTRLSPSVGIKRLLGTGTMVEIAKGVVKMVVVLAVTVVSLVPDGRELPRLAGAPAQSVLAALGLLVGRLAIRVALALVGLGTIDWLLARRRHRKSLMMTRDEVKREYKEAEGDPQHRLERQRLRRELGEQRAIDDVRKADFVVVNPDHIAVAVKYDRDADAAPVVVAKGERLLAERIKQVARESGVPIYRDLGLARALNELPEGEEIPEALYEAVAELMRVLWEMDPRSEIRADPTRGGARAAATIAGSVSATWKRV
jgi:flagellar biosynthesis protein FlhB